MDQLLRGGQLYPDSVVGSLDLARGGQELLEEIMSTPTDGRLDQPVAEHLGETARPHWELPETSATPRGHRRALIAVAATVAFIAAATGPTLALRGGDEVAVSPGGHASAPAEDKTGNPRLVLDDPAWKITHVDETDAANGEIEFKNGRRWLQVNWYEAKTYPGYHESRLKVSKPATFLVLDQKGERFRYSATDFAVMLPPKGLSFLEIRGVVGDAKTFAAELAKLKPVSLDQWLAAMPSSVITPDRAQAATKAMLADVPLPPGFEPVPLNTGDTNDEYQYGAAVIGNVTCAWLKQYEVARIAKDEPGMATVDKALATSRGWKILLTMDKEGDYPEVVWDYAHRVAQRTDVNGYPAALGCD
jgi:hypothetical protein